MAVEATSVIERVKQKLDIVEEIGAIVPLKKSGKAWRGLCPFHGERTPSFYVYPDGHWRCFGCSEHGDLITFVEKTQGLDFLDALALLAEKAGVSLDRRADTGDGSEAAEGSARKRLRALNEAAAIWFHAQLLQSPAAQYCRAYLESRGVSNESIATWRLGFAPDGDQLSRYLLTQGYTAKELIEGGFAREREQTAGGGLRDYFHNRLMFPIRNQAGQTIAFGGRELGGGHPKYLNTQQTVLFDKSATLFGLDLARDAIKRGDRVVVVEGYMDAIVPYQYGFRNVVAVIGSALTEKHVHHIKRLTRRVTLALDPDAAGESATVRGIQVAQKAFDRIVVPVPGAAPGAPTNRRGEPKGLVRFEEQVDAEITVARLPPHEDPDEFVRRDPEGWRRAIEQAQPLIDFLIEVETAGLALDTPQGKAEARKRLLPVIAEARDRTLADEYVGRLAQKLRLDKIELRRDLALTRQRLDRETRASRQREHDAAASAEAESSVEGQAADEALGVKYRQTAHERPTQGYSSSSASGGMREHALLAEYALEAYCLGLALDYPTAWAEVSAILDGRDFATPEFRALYDALGAMSGDPFSATADFIETLHPLLRAAAEQARAAIIERERDATHVVKDAREAAYRLKSLRLKSEMAELDALQREAEQAGDSDSLRALLARKAQLLAQRRAIDSASSGALGRPGKSGKSGHRRHTP
ncbi:MAG TPA: DNA primase [Ktedonobacterales bacterium]